MFSEKRITAHQVIVRLQIIARETGVSAEQLRLIALIGDHWFALTQDNFEIDHLGILRIELPSPIAEGQ